MKKAQYPQGLFHLTYGSDTVPPPSSSVPRVIGLPVWIFPTIVEM